MRMMPRVPKKTFLYCKPNSALGDDAAENLITRCADCHSDVHRNTSRLREH
jgi:hypothetical protein